MDIVLDFDATCTDHCFPRIGVEVPSCVRTLKSWSKRKHNVCLCTMRSGKQLDEAVAWFHERELKLYGVQTNPTQSQWTSSPKCDGDIEIDDRALGIPLIKYPSFRRVCVQWETVVTRDGTKVYGVADLFDMPRKIVIIDASGRETLGTTEDLL